MSKVKQTVTLGIANTGEKNFKVEDILDWKPEKISYMGDSVFFQVDETFYSMKRLDFREIFNGK
jgi:hypothetical protein